MNLSFEHAAQFPARMKLRHIRDHVFVQEGVAPLDRRMHRDPVALAREQVARQHDPRPEVHLPVERVPAVQVRRQFEVVVSRFRQDSCSRPPR